MHKIVLFFLFAIALYAQTDQKTENTNITIREGDYVYNYDRLRLRLDWQDNELFSTVIADGVNFLGESYTNSELFAYKQQLRSDTPFKTQTEFADYNGGVAYAKVYRAYGGYQDEQNRLVIGLQNISMGVGRIWQVTNIYNPKNIYAIESDETFGVAGVLYTRYFDQTSHVSGIVSLDHNKEARYALRYQGFFETADFALDLVQSKDITMLGYEIDGNLPNGMGVRSEGAYFDTNASEFFQGIVGFDYGFEDGLTLVVEALYSSKIFTPEEIAANLQSSYVQNMVASHYFGALTLSYPFNIYLDGSLVYIEGFDGEGSRFFSPTITYTLNDYNTFSLGAMLYDQKSSAEDMDRYFLKWDLSF